MTSAPDTMQAPDPRAVADHLRMLFGADDGDAPGWLPIWTTPGKGTMWIPGDALFGDTPDRIAALAPTSNAYHAAVLQRARAKRGRGGEPTTLAMPSCWFDLDVRGPTHKKSTALLPESRQVALDFLAALPLQPSLVIDTGGGLHVHWIFTRLQVFTSDADRATAKALSTLVHRALIARGAAHGWSLDKTEDLARVLRVAGTLNHKTTPPALVRIIYASDARYAPIDLLALAATPTRTTLARGAA